MRLTFCIVKLDASLPDPELTEILSSCTATPSLVITVLLGNGNESPVIVRGVVKDVPSRTVLLVMFGVMDGGTNKNQIIALRH